MATRHRIPTIFNLSMVDVLCCALGCVILLWLLNLREAKQRAQAAGQTDLLLTAARTDLDETGRRLRASEELAAAADIRLRQTVSERDALAHDLAAAQARQTELSQSLVDAKGDHAAAQDRLAKKVKESAALSRDLVAARQRIAGLDVLIREREAKVLAAARSAEDLSDRLRDADARLTQIRTQVNSIKDDSRSTRERMSTAEARVQALEKELAGAGRTVESLEGEKRALTEQIIRTRAAVDHRFAGISLTGRRVVFLVDMSGSMDSMDDKTPSPDKWPGVSQALTHVMRSLPELEKFQVILFSTRVVYLLGNEDGWHDYDPETSTFRVSKAMAAVKPSGDTDMYAGFAAAFQKQRQGLDTIYVFSDGLPTVGAGLETQDAQNLSKLEQTQKLSKHVRDTLRTVWNTRTAGRPPVKINTIGFFYESPDVGAFLWALSRENDGSFVGMSKP